MILSSLWSVTVSQQRVFENRPHGLSLCKSLQWLPIAEFRGLPLPGPHYATSSIHCVLQRSTADQPTALGVAWQSKSEGPEDQERWERKSQSEGRRPTAQHKSGLATLQSFIPSQSMKTLLTLQEPARIKSPQSCWSLTHDSPMAYSVCLYLVLILFNFHVFLPTAQNPTQARWFVV